MKPDYELSQRAFPLEALKVCPLCGAVNAMSSEECFACSWHGAFEHSADDLEDGLANLVEQCPDLADTVLHDLEERRPERRARLKAFFKKLLWRSIS